MATPTSYPTQLPQNEKAPNPLAVYLNDHLAGSSATMELLEHLQQARTGTPLGQFAAELKKEVFEDRQQLQLLMLQLNIPESRLRQAGAWIFDQLLKLKTDIKDRADGTLGLLELLEFVAIGVDGKIALWSAMSEVAKGTPELAKLDYESLRQRACGQRKRIEEKRLSAAVDALRFPPPPIAPRSMPPV